MSTIEYFARGLRDRILVDGKTVVSRVPIFWFYQNLDFEIPYRDGRLPATVRVKMHARSLRLKLFELEIKGTLVYREIDGKQVPVSSRV